MTCERYPDPVDAERYVSGEMSESEQAAFEEHFFACDTCFERVRDLQQVQAALRAGGTRRAEGKRSIKWVAALAAAAVLLLAVGAWQWSARRTRTGESAQGDHAATAAQTPSANDDARRAGTRQAALSTLALVTPPSFTPLTTRGNETSARRQFDAAMAKYAAGQYADAEAGLSTVVTSAPDLAPAHFYLGVSRLLLGHPADARAPLEAAASLGVSPWSGESHFYLAKAALALDDVATATAELRTAAAAGAGPAGEATRILAALNDLPR